jgi:aspartyl-tRNA(Asn)/glutamyl-tRNA(Gln) amidotransferase subunit C
MVDSSEVSKIIRLAHLEVEESRLPQITNELNSILECVAKLQAVNVSSVEPMSHVHGSTNVYRNDEIEPGLTTAEALSNAPDKSGAFIRVPIIIDQGTDN